MTRSGGRRVSMAEQKKLTMERMLEIAANDSAVLDDLARAEQQPQQEPQRQKSEIQLAAPNAYFRHMKERIDASRAERQNSQKK